MTIEVREQPGEQPSEQPRVCVIQGGGRPRGNTYHLCQAAAHGATAAGAEVRSLSLVGKRISPCLGYACDHCRTNGGDCRIDDDFHAIYREVLASDGIIIASPVYVGTVSAQLKAFMERFRAGSIGALFHGMRDPLRDKVGGALCVGIHPYGGQEFALQSIINFFLAEEMIVVGGDTPNAYFGAAGESGAQGPHPCPPDSILDSHRALEAARTVGTRVATIARALMRHVN
ncbi:MAG: flavodoxin family protein [Ignavibacteriales bacterium]